MNLEGKGFPGPQRLFESNVIDFERVEDVLLPGLTAPLAAIQPDLPLFGMQLQSEQLQNILRTVAFVVAIQGEDDRDVVAIAVPEPFEFCDSGEVRLNRGCVAVAHAVVSADVGNNLTRIIGKELF